MSTHSASSTNEATRTASSAARVDHSHVNEMNKVAGAGAVAKAANPYANKVTSEKGASFFSQGTAMQDAGQQYRKALVESVTVAKPSAASTKMTEEYNKTAPPEAQVPKAAASIIADVAAKMAKASPFATAEQKSAADRHAQGGQVRLDELASAKGLANMATVAKQYITAKMMNSGTAVEEARRAAFAPGTTPGA